MNLAHNVCVTYQIFTCRSDVDILKTTTKVLVQGILEFIVTHAPVFFCRYDLHIIVFNHNPYRA